MQDILRDLLGSVSGQMQLRFQRRKSIAIKVENAKLKDVNLSNFAGVGIRILLDGTWGFSSTADLSKDGVFKAIKEAHVAAALGRGLRVSPGLNDCPVVGEFKPQVLRPLSSVSIEEKIELCRLTEEKLRLSNPLIQNSDSFYSEYIDDKIILTSAGTDVLIHDPKSMFYVTNLACKDDQMETGSASCGATGGWDELFRHCAPLEMADNASRMAINKLDAEMPVGGLHTVILDPSLVGLLAHEAIGHTVETDFVESGAITKDKIGQKVASQILTLVDDPKPCFDPAGAGVIEVDDEGNLSKKATIIKDGILNSYLHDSESSKKYGVDNTGNARAFTYKDEPLIRMRNTYFEAGKTPFEEMLANTEKGIYLKNAGGGQADSNAEFMFMASEAWQIEKGKLTKPLKGVSISGQAFEVLQSVDLVGDKVMLDMGAGHCGKFQPARVDGGGPHLRCVAKLGGKL